MVMSLPNAGLPFSPDSAKGIATIQLCRELAREYTQLRIVEMVMRPGSLFSTECSFDVVFAVDDSSIALAKHLATKGLEFPITIPGSRPIEIIVKLRSPTLPAARPAPRAPSAAPQHAAGRPAAAATTAPAAATPRKRRKAKKRGGSGGRRQGNGSARTQPQGQAATEGSPGGRAPAPGLPVAPGAGSPASDPSRPTSPPTANQMPLTVPLENRFSPLATLEADAGRGKRKSDDVPPEASNAKKLTWAEENVEMEAAEVATGPGQGGTGVGSAPGGADSA
ncbi:hypothetical protein DFJ74DRAFT_685002 [Hyaloraphidium curvatum]|nr:hypothetical protein DFJ74DRAFT_685002 [Hyaloraphidium curvatum]